MGSNNNLHTISFQFMQTKFTISFSLQSQLKTHIHCVVFLKTLLYKHLFLMIPPCGQRVTFHSIFSLLCAHLWRRESVYMFYFAEGWCGKPPLVSVCGAQGPANMLDHLATCMSVWTDGPSEGQLQANHWICHRIHW